MSRSEVVVYMVAWAVFGLVLWGTGTGFLGPLWDHKLTGGIVSGLTVFSAVACAWSLLRIGWFGFLCLWLAAAEGAAALTERAREVVDGPTAPPSLTCAPVGAMPLPPGSPPSWFSDPEGFNGASKKTCEIHGLKCPKCGKVTDRALWDGIEKPPERQWRPINCTACGW